MGDQRTGRKRTEMYELPDDTAYWPAECLLRLHMYLYRGFTRKQAEAFTRTWAATKDQPNDE